MSDTDDNSMTTPLFTPEFLERHEAELREALPSLYDDEGAREIVAEVLIPHFREKINEIIAANDAGSSMKAQVNGMCEAIDSMLIENKELLDVDGLFAPCMQIINGVRKSVRDQLLMEGEYFKNVENVRADLEAFAKAAGVTIKNLNTGPDHVSKRALCANNELVRFAQYLIKADVGLGLVKAKGKEVLSFLKKKCGFEEEVRLMDKDYFNIKNITYDLNAFALASNRTLDELSLGICSTVEAVCANGEKVKWPTYLRRAGVAFDLAEGKKWINSLSVKALEILKGKVGIEVKLFSPQDAVYFSRREKVLEDLQKFADLAEVPIEQLTTSNINNISITCANGESVIGERYLLRASVALGFTYKDTGGKLIRKKGPALVALKKLVGIEIEEYPEMDSVYFINVSNVLNDLTLFAEGAGVSIEELNSSNASKIIIICSNGEEVLWTRYLRRAAKALGLVSSLDDADGKYLESLVILQKIVGFKITQYPAMDSVYFLNTENIRHDLMAFALAAGISVGKANTTSIAFSCLAVCKNGESVTWAQYTSRAGVSLGLAKNSAGSNSIRSDTIEKLKKMIGIELEKYPEMDAKYFSDISNIRNDLKSYSLAVDRPIADFVSSGRNMESHVAKCSNGEHVKWNTYLKRASVGLGLASNTKLAISKRGETLALLKKLSTQ